MCPNTLYDVWNQIRAGNIECKKYEDGFDILQSNPQLLSKVMTAINGISYSTDQLLAAIAKEAYSLYRKSKGYAAYAG
jgi:hypothetical protein